MVTLAPIGMGGSPGIGIVVQLYPVEYVRTMSWRRSLQSR
jgi:hypothetical protein